MGIDDVKKQKVAIKIVSKAWRFRHGAKSQLKFKSEMEILKKLNHHRIIKCYDVFEDDDSFYIVLELASGGDLFELLS